MRSGFMNDSTGTNPSDPSSLNTQGIPTNGPYQPNYVQMPDGTILVESKVPKDWKKEYKFNQCFYGFGGSTNIKQLIDED